MDRMHLMSIWCSLVNYPYVLITVNSGQHNLKPDTAIGGQFILLGIAVCPIILSDSFNEAKILSAGMLL